MSGALDLDDWERRIPDGLSCWDDQHRAIQEIRSLRLTIDRAATLLHDGLKSRPTVRTREAKELAHYMSEARKLLRAAVSFEGKREGDTDRPD